MEVVWGGGGEGEDVFQGWVGDAEGAEVEVVLCDEGLVVVVGATKEKRTDVSE